MSGAQLAQAIREAGLAELPPDALSRFGQYLELLLKWNSRLNLTAIRERDAILKRHFVECIQCAQALPEALGARLLDFGSGAGLPGIPIAICRPEIRVTLAESQGKKVAFLREAVRTLELDAEVWDGRVGDLPKEARFDLVTLRAVDKMAEACGIARERVAPKGWIVVFATESVQAGLKQALLGIEWVREIPIAGLDRGRILIGQRVV
ncbi:MAG: 16S rRNA (guanine(527)-N(7))-methyltransferase RsmG [Acidobacteriaceae bacterium]